MRCALLAVVAAIGIALAGCAGVPVADEALDREAKAFAANPGKAMVYVYRDGDAGEGVPMEVLLDGVPLGRSAPRTFFAFEAEPGRRAITSRAANEATLVVEAEAGRSHFVRQEARWGFTGGRTALVPVDEPTGRAGVAKCRLVPGTQAVEVSVEAADGRRAGPLDCVAANAFGPRAFRAPGTVTVFASVTDLRITCRLPGGGEATAVSGAVGAPVLASRAAAEGRGAGAKLGAVAGIAAGAASVPVMGPALAIFIAAGSVARGAEIGGIAGALAAGGQVSYPSPIVLRIVAD
ncbi:MAG: DUF2846 domain-containing protein [Burkholderiales bacterium]|nr:DUF2846 domain-containing protein [Burkholderiales bacterium]